MPDKQGELFPEDKPEKQPKDTKKTEAAKTRREERAKRKTRKQGWRIQDQARRREWERRKERGEVFGDMPDDFLLESRNALTIQKLFQQAHLGRTALQIVKGAGSALSLLIGTPDRL